MLSISINKHIDYSAPIMFMALGIPTNTTKPTPSTSVKTNTPAKKVAVTKPAAATKPSPKPTTVATAIPKKAETVKADEIKKFEPVKKEIAQKETPKIEPKPITPAIEQVAKVEQKTTPPIAQAIDTQQTITPIVPENAHVSHNYREVEALRKQAQLQKELVQKWKPPIGISPDCMCEISFFVTSKGTVENIKMVKSSGVVMFDISARQALFAMKMPQWTYGKPFMINFNQ